MNVELLREIAGRTPFESFIIHMNDGSKFTVREPDGFVVPDGWSVNALVTLEHD